MEEIPIIGIQVGHRVALMVLSLMLLALVLELVRRDLLKERYALLWLATSIFGLVIGVFPSLIVQFAILVRFQMLTALFVFAFLFFLGLVLGFTVIFSRLSERNRTLTQELAILAYRVDRMEAGPRP